MSNQPQKQLDLVMRQMTMPEALAVELESASLNVLLQVHRTFKAHRQESPAALEIAKRGLHRYLEPGDLLPDNPGVKEACLLDLTQPENVKRLKFLRTKRITALQVSGNFQLAVQQKEWESRQNRRCE